MINHHISELVARINNACNRKSTKLSLKNTKDNLAIVSNLEKEGFISVLNYNNNEINILINSIKKIKVISTPGRRIYTGWKNLHDGYYSYITLIRTSKGIKTSHEAIINKLGGEVLLKIQ